MNNQRGMTLVELLAVIVLIGLIATVVIRGVSGTSEMAKARVNGIRMEKLRSSLSQYRLEYNGFPDSLAGLVRPSATAKNSGKPFFALASDEEIKDAWGNDFQYKLENNGRSYSLSSLGADGVPGGADANQDVTVGP